MPDAPAEAPPAPASPNGATPPPADSQPPPSPDASVSPPPPAAEAAPAPAGETPPAAAPPAADAAKEAEQKAAADAALPKLKGETIAALVRTYGPDFMAVPEVQETINRQAQSIADKAIAERQMQPAEDAEYAALQDRVNTGVNAIVQATQKIEKGETVDPREFAGLHVQLSELADVRADRGAFVLVNAALHQGIKETLGVIDEKDPEKPADPLNQQYGQAIEEHAREFGAALKEKDPDKRSQLRAQTQAKFYRRAIKIALEAGKRAGAQETQKKAERERADAVTLAGDTSLNEALARLAAGEAPPAPQAGAESAVFTSLEQVTKARAAGKFATDEDFLKAQNKVLGLT